MLCTWIESYVAILTARNTRRCQALTWHLATVTSQGEGPSSGPEFVVAVNIITDWTLWRLERFFAEHLIPFTSRPAPCWTPECNNRDDAAARSQPVHCSFPLLDLASSAASPVSQHGGSWECKEDATLIYTQHHHPSTPNYLWAPFN